VPDDYVLPFVALQYGRDVAVVRISAESALLSRPLTTAFGEHRALELEIGPVFGRPGFDGKGRTEPSQGQLSYFNTRRPNASGA